MAPKGVSNRTLLAKKKGIKMGQTIMVAYREDGKGDKKVYEGLLSDRRIGGTDRESYLVLKKCLLLGSKGEIVAMEGDKRFVDAFLDDMDITEPRSHEEITAFLSASQLAGAMGAASDSAAGSAMDMMQMAAMNPGMQAMSPGMGMMPTMGMSGMGGMPMGMNPMGMGNPMMMGMANPMSMGMNMGMAMAAMNMGMGGMGMGMGGKGGKDSYGKGGAGGDSQAHSNIFVGNLSESTTKEELEAAFGEHGEVKSCSVMNKSGRTFGFVKLGSVVAASAAVKKMATNPQGWMVKFANNDAVSSGGKGGYKGDGKGYIGGKGGDPMQKVDHSNVFVSGLPTGTTEERLMAVFGPHGKIKSCHISTKAGAEEGESIYGLVEFLTVAEADAAAKALDGQAGWSVKMANNDARSGGWDATLPHSNVFIGNLAEDIDKDMLNKIFSQHGTVLSCVLHDNKPDEGEGEEGAQEGATDGKRYGFVKFATVAAAARAIDALEGSNGWAVKPANNDTGGAGKGWGKGYYWVPEGAGFDDWGSRGAGWIWQPNERPKTGEAERPEPAPSDNLYVKDLPPGISEEEVHATFSKVGSVVECRVLRWDNASGCAALVRMASMELAARARAQLSGTVHDSCLVPLQVGLQEKKGGEKVEDHLYIKGLPCTSTPDQLRTLFGRFGTVTWCRVLPLPFEPRNGSVPDVAALVQMSSPSEAQFAIEGLNGRTSAELGQPMTVRFAESKPGGPEQADAKPNNNIYVKGWPVGFPDFLLQSIFQQYGSVLRLRLLDNPDPEQPTCAALVQMSRVEEAAVAVRQLHGRTMAVSVPPIHVRYAGKDQGNSDNLYVSSLPRTITESSLRQTFLKYGEIKRLRLLQQPGSHETRALVQLGSPQAAAQALRELDGSTPNFKGPTLFVAYAAKREGGDRRP